MSFYKITESIDTKTVGTYPQLQKLDKSHDVTSRHSCTQVARYFFNETPPDSIDFSGLKIERKTKLTDIMSSSYLNPLAGLFLSERFYLFLSTKIIPPSKVFKVRLIDTSSTEFIYYWLHYTSVLAELVDFSRSVFYIDEPVKQIKFQIESIAEYLNIQKTAKYIVRSRNIYLTKFASTFDLIRIGEVNSQTYITKKIRDEILDHGFTGFNCELTNEISF